MAIVLWTFFLWGLLRNPDESKRWEPVWVKAIGGKFRYLWTEVSRDETKQEKIEKEKLAEKKNQKNRYKRNDILDIE